MDIAFAANEEYAGSSPVVVSSFGPEALLVMRCPCTTLICGFDSHPVHHLIAVQVFTDAREFSKLEDTDRYCGAAPYFLYNLIHFLQRSV